jgi:plastocyanin
MLTAAIVGACCVGVGAVLMTSAARSAAVTVPVSVGPGGMLVFNPANVTAHQGDTVKWTWDSSGHTTTDTTGLGLWDSKIRSVHATFTHKFVHAGTFGYHCQVHFSLGMVGSVKVPLMLTRSGTKVTVRWASSAPAAGFVEDVQQQKPGAVGFTALVTGSTAQAKAITLTRGTWKFRARYRNSRTGKASGYSPVATVKIS